MFCAQSVAAVIEAKRVEEMIQAAIEEERRKAEIAAKFKENIQKFVDKDMAKVDAFIEKRLIEGKGVFRHIICDNCWDDALELPHWMPYPAGCHPSDAAYQHLRRVRSQSEHADRQYYGHQTGSGQPHRQFPWP